MSMLERPLGGLPGVRTVFFGWLTGRVLEKVQRSHGDQMYLGSGRVRAVVGGAVAAGTFVVCHDTLTYGNFPDYGPAICRGFFDAYADRSPALILLRACQRLIEVPPPPATRTPGMPGTGRRPSGPSLPDGSEALWAPVDLKVLPA
jgi:hypothetical protein